MAPLFKYGLFGEGVSLALAILIGFGFGFALERAGFGSAKKLVAQFYLTDLAVFKVMFTAIVTAMLGLYYLAAFGVLDLGMVYVEPTHLLPQTVGGFVLGAGFIIGGYCPGTSIVGIASGRRDALFYLGGMALGIFAFGEGSSFIDAFYQSTPKGVLTLPEAFGLPYGVVVAAVVAMALGCFRLAEWVERRGEKAAKPSPTAAAPAPAE
ncbi:MAG: YeeE/YedE family protein [Myxococcales bacterium]|nr:YeeE/YedE family protein [Myxococcales bacterium]